jgi:hypothetical protein
LELYKLAVEMADRASARRASLLTLPFTANTALFAILSTRSANNILWLVAAGGIIISLSWWVLLSSYRQLNSAKFSVIAEMEDNLEVRIFTNEWMVVRDRYEFDNLRHRILQASMVEKVVPISFVALYAAALVTSLL